MTTVRIVAGMQLLCAVGALLGAVLVAGEPPAEEVSRQPSTYAPAKDLAAKCREMGLLCCTAGEHVVRFLPPLNVRDDELEEALDMLDDALDMLYGEEAEAATETTPAET